MKTVAGFIRVLEQRTTSEVREDFILNFETVRELEYLKYSEPSEFLGLVGRTHILDNKLRILGQNPSPSGHSSKFIRAIDMLKAMPTSGAAILVFRDYFCYLYSDGRIQMNIGQTFTADSE